jgi:hypothetical protein
MLSLYHCADEEYVKVSSIGMHQFTKGKWENLTKLKITFWVYHKGLGQKGCKYLSRMTLPHIK